MLHVPNDNEYRVLLLYEVCDIDTWKTKIIFFVECILPTDEGGVLYARCFVAARGVGSRLVCAQHHARYCTH